MINSKKISIVLPAYNVEKTLELDSDIIVMLHPDYQYTPKLIHSMC